MPTCRITDKRVAKEATRKALSNINSASMQSLGITFSEAIVKYCPEERIMLTPTAAEKKKTQRSVMRSCKRHVEEQMGAKDALNVLSENQSMSSYKRMRLSQSFESPQAKKQRYMNNPPKFKGIPLISIMSHGINSSWKQH